MKASTLAVLATASSMLFLTGCKSPSLVPQDAWVQQVSSGYTFTEGPAADGKGNIYFTDIPNQRIMRYDIAGKREFVYRENSGGANGLMFDSAGHLYTAEGGNRRVTRTDAAGNVEVLGGHYGIFRFNSPNDLVFDAQGGVYVTDPRYGNRDSMELEVEGVYYIPAKGQVVQVVSNLLRPNGVILCPAGKVLYVADHAGKTIWAWDVTGPGQLANGRVFAWLDPNGGGGADGMTVDTEGRLYAAAQGHVWVWAPDGTPLDRIKVPEDPSNVAFGGPGSNVLYITARTSLYRITLNAKGIR